MDNDAILRLLQEVPFINSPKACSLLSSVLTGLNLSHLPATGQIQFLEKIQNTVDLVASNTRSSGLLADNKQADTIQLAFSYLYCSAIADFVKSLPGVQASSEIITAVHRALYHLQQIQQSVYLFYGSLPTMWWFQLNNLYAIAERFQFLTTPGLNVTMQNEEAQTVADTYKQCILLATADPSHLSQKDLRALFMYIKNWSKLVEINLPCKANDLFVVDIAKDAAPLRSQTDEIPKFGEWRSLNVAKVIPELTQLKQMLINIPEHVIVSDGHVVTKTFVDKLLLNWQTRPTRRFHRIQQAGKVATSFKITDADEGESENIWDIVNVSPDGYCLEREADTLGSVIAGGLIRISERRDNQASDWQVGVLRWVNHTHEGLMRVGVQLLSPLAKHVTVKVSGQAQPIHALLLPKLAKVRSQETLVVPSAFGQVGDILSIENEEQAFQVKLASPVEHHVRYRQFQFSPVG